MKTGINITIIFAVISFCCSPSVADGFSFDPAKPITDTNYIVIRDGTEIVNSPLKPKTKILAKKGDCINIIEENKQFDDWYFLFLPFTPIIDEHNGESLKKPFFFFIKKSDVEPISGECPGATTKENSPGIAEALFTSTKEKFEVGQAKKRKIAEMWAESNAKKENLADFKKIWKKGMMRSEIADNFGFTKQCYGRSTNGRKRIIETLTRTDKPINYYIFYDADNAIKVESKTSECINPNKDMPSLFYIPLPRFFFDQKWGLTYEQLKKDGYDLDGLINSEKMDLGFAYQHGVKKAFFFKGEKYVFYEVKGLADNTIENYRKLMGAMFAYKDKKRSKDGSIKYTYTNGLHFNPQYKVVLIKSPGNNLLQVYQLDLWEKLNGQ